MTKSALSPYLNETLLPRAAKVRARLELAGRIDKGSGDYMMGHRSEGVAARYIHLRPEEALGSWGGGCIRLPHARVGTAAHGLTAAVFRTRS